MKFTIGPALQYIDSSEFAHRMLTRHLFPNHSSNIAEVPPIVNTLSFSRSCAEELASMELSAERKRIGFDATLYGLSRTDHTIRRAHIPHPQAFSRLVFTIEKHWNSLQTFIDNKHSMIRPMMHPDGRVFVYNDYDESDLNYSENANVESFGKRYRVSADVKGFFPSIYSHSLAWALVGKSAAKASSNAKDAYYNELDYEFRLGRRKETNGVLIGPGTSNVAGEIILGAVDRQLQKQFALFHRHVDDYTFLASSQTEAELFLRTLSSILSQYELILNDAKIRIEELPQPNNPEWVTMLASMIPSRESSHERVKSYIDLAIHYSNTVKKSTCLVFAFTTLINNLDHNQITSWVFLPLLRLCYHHPRLIPLLDRFFQLDWSLAEMSQDTLHVLAHKSSESEQSDMSCWCLHYILSTQQSISDSLGVKVLESTDCLPIAIALSSGSIPSRAIDEFIQTILDEQDPYTCDRYWPVLYEYYLQSVDRKKSFDPAFDVLSRHEVRFIGIDRGRGETPE